MLQYTFCKSPWVVTFPMVIERIGFGLATGCIAPVLNHVTCSIDPNLSGALNGVFLAVYNIAVTMGKSRSCI